MELIKIAWRNIWRSKTRSLVVIAAVCIGMTGGIFASAIMFGMMDSRVETAIATEVAHIQLHNPDFVLNQDQEFTIENADELEAKISKIDGVNVCSRLKINAMASSAETGTGIIINGIEPDKEIKVSDLNTKLTKGDYFAEDKSNQIFVGEKFAEKLNLDIRSKVVLTFQDNTGTITGGTFRVCGIYKTSNNMYDEMQVFVRKSDLTEITLDDMSSAHEIAVLIDDNERLMEVTDEIKKITGDKILVQNWKELSPDLAMITDMMGQFGTILVFIILMALAFGIINTMLMAILERKKELGMLMAVGMNRRKIRRMITWETIFLTVTGTIIGMGFSYFLISFFAEKGINLNMYAEAFEELGYSSMLYPVLNTEFFIQVTILTIITALFAAIFPIRRAIKMNPAEVLRTE